VFRDPRPSKGGLPIRLLLALIFAMLWVALPVATMAQSPTAPPSSTPPPSPVLIDPLDPRAGDESVNLVGAPVLAVVVVLASGALAAVGTIAYVKLTGSRATRR
jgi:hypothetical protein